MGKPRPTPGYAYKGTRCGQVNYEIVMLTESDCRFSAYEKDTQIDGQEYCCFKAGPKLRYFQLKHMCQGNTK